MSNNALAPVEESVVVKNNNLTATEALTAKINKLKATPIPAVVQNELEVMELASCAKECKGVIKLIETSRKAYTSKLDAVKKQILAQEKVLIKPLERIIDSIRIVCDKYTTEQKRIEEEAKERARLIAEEAQRKLDEARRAQEEVEAAKALGVAPSADLAEKAETAQKEAAEAIVQASDAFTPDELRAMTPISGTAVRKSWAFTITNAALVPRKYLVVDEALIRADLNAMKAQGYNIADVNIPGVAVMEKVTTQFR